MTWIAASSTYNYGLIVSDHRISWCANDDVWEPERQFGVMKVAQLAPNVIGAFSGSVHIGLDLLARLRAMFGQYPTKPPDHLFNRYYNYLYREYRSLPYDEYRDIGCDLLLVGLVPPDVRQFHFPALDSVGGPFLDLTLGCVISCPTPSAGWQFEMFGVDLRYPAYDYEQGATWHAGSGSLHPRYQELLESRLSPERVKGLDSMLKAGSEWPARIQSMLLEEMLPTEVDPAVSRTLHVSTIDRDGAVILVPKEHEDDLPLAMDLKMFRALCFQHSRGAAAARG